MEDLIRQHKVSGGMILKLEAAQTRACRRREPGAHCRRHAPAAGCCPRHNGGKPRHARSARRSFAAKPRQAARGLLKMTTKIEMASKTIPRKAKSLTPAQIRDARSILLNTYRRPP